jgi:hypothetical protein
VTVHRRVDPYSRARVAARDLARAEPRNQRLHAAPSLAAYAPQALLYPLQVENLVLVLAFGLAQTGLAMLFPDLWLAKLVPCALVVFLLEVASHTAHGFATPPIFTVEHLVGVASRGFTAIVLVGAVAFGLAAASTSIAPGITLLLLGLSAVLLPAQLGLLALTGELAVAFDPRRWWGVLVAGGVAYWIVVVIALAALAGAAGLRPAWAAAFATLPAPGVFLSELAQVYFFFAVAHLLGAAFHLRREVLGFEAIVTGRSEGEHDAESMQESVARLLKLADEEEHHERHEAAAQLLLTAPIGSYPPRPWLEELFEGACRRPKPYFAEAAGQRLVAQLCATQQWARALEVVVHAAQRWPRFQPAALDQRVALAERALELRATLAFRQLTERLDALGAVPLAVDLGFLVARWRAEREDDAAGALQALAPLLARREHPAHRRIAALDAALRGGRKA